MLIRPLREFYDDMGKVTPKDVLDVNDWKGADLIRRGLAVDVQGKAGDKPGPTQSPQTDIRTGGEKQSSSSRQGRAQRTSTSALRAAGRGSSSSTTHTGSRPGLTSSTPATAPGGEQSPDLLTSKD